MDNKTRTRGVGAAPVRRRSTCDAVGKIIIDCYQDIFKRNLATYHADQLVHQPVTYSDILTMEVSKGWLLTAPFFGYVLAWVTAL